MLQQSWTIFENRWSIRMDLLGLIECWPRLCPREGDRPAKRRREGEEDEDDPMDEDDAEVQFLIMAESRIKS